MTEQDLIHKIEWVNKRCSLKGEPLTQSQIELLKFVFADIVVNKNFALADVSRLLLLFDQMIKEENEALGKTGFYNQYGRETHANNKYCLAIVKSLIERRFGNSG